MTRAVTEMHAQSLSRGNAVDQVERHGNEF